MNVIDRAYVVVVATAVVLTCAALCGVWAAREFSILILRAEMSSW